MTKGVLVLIEHVKGVVTEVSFELLGAGRTVADALQAPLYAVLPGETVAPLTANLGIADEVLTVESAGLRMPDAGTVAGLLRHLVDQKQATLVLIGGTNASMGTGSFLSARTGFPYFNFCRALKVDNGAIVLTCQLFGGKLLADVRLADARGVVCVCPGAFPAEAGRSTKAAGVESVALPLAPARMEFRGFLEPEPGDVDITKQDVLVAVGRGIRSQDNLPIVGELVDALAGAVCASRPVVDQGWLPLTRQVGKSGMTVKPKLYLALGISGAPEHQEGMREAELIIAVNTDPRAPIFDLAHYGTTADLFDLVPALNKAIKRRKG